MGPAALGIDPSQGQGSNPGSDIFYFWHLYQDQGFNPLFGHFFTFDTFYHFVIQNNRYQDY